MKLFEYSSLNLKYTGDDQSVCNDFKEITINAELTTETVKSLHRLWSWELRTWSLTNPRASQLSGG